MSSSIWPDIISFGIFTLVIIVIYTIIILFIARFNRKTAGTTATINGLKIILRFLVILIIVVAAFTIFEESDQFILSLSSISGILIGFASTEIVGQIVSGLILITSKPFLIEDLVKIDKYEGVVEEINLNHTIVRQFDGTMVKIPNKKLMDSQFLNYTLEMDPSIQKHQGLEEKTTIVENSSKNEIKWYDTQEILRIFADLADMITDQKVTRYTFEIELDFKKNPEMVISRLEAICQQYQSIYQYKPKFAIVELGWRPTVKFWIFCGNPYIIMTNQNNLIADIAEAMYEIPEDENS